MGPHASLAYRRESRRELATVVAVARPRRRAGQRREPARRCDARAHRRRHASGRRIRRPAHRQRLRRPDLPRVGEKVAPGGGGPAGGSRLDDGLVRSSLAAGSFAAPGTPRVSDDPDLALDYSPWLYWSGAPASAREAQLVRHRELAERADVRLGEDCYLSPLASIEPRVFRLGDKSYVAAHAYITGTISAGDNCTFNVLSVVRGTVPSTGVGERLLEFADTARAQAGDVRQRSWDETVPDGRYLDRPGATVTVREGRQPLEFGVGEATYHVLCVGYALDLMGSRFPWPVEAVRSMTAEGIVSDLESLPWHSEGWGAGAWVDAWATAAHWNLGQAAAMEPGALEALFGWLLTRANPAFGTWGEPTSGQAALQVINGYYRLTRRSFAQFAVPVPYPEQLI